MGQISQEVGKRIKTYRKVKNLTLSELSEKVYKSVSTLSKYEKGEISIDVETLYAIAEALNVHPEQLLMLPNNVPIRPGYKILPTFFAGINRFYGYYYDGRTSKIVRSVFDIFANTYGNSFHVMMYMNFQDYALYQKCENIYEGSMEHYDAVTNISLTNLHTPMEQASVQILASYLGSTEKWALFNGFSSRPMMPVAAKMLITKEPVEENKELIKMLKISKEDIRQIKMYNMFPVT